jgi:hypothetical protein
LKIEKLPEARASRLNEIRNGVIAEGNERRRLATKVRFGDAAIAEEEKSLFRHPLLAHIDQDFAQVQLAIREIDCLHRARYRSLYR